MDTLNDNANEHERLEQDEKCTTFFSFPTPTTNDFDSDSPRMSSFLQRVLNLIYRRHCVSETEGEALLEVADSLRNTPNLLFSNKKSAIILN